MTTNTTNNQEAQVNTLVNTQENHKVNRIDALARLVRDRWSKSDANDDAALKEELRKFAKTQPDHHLGDDEPGLPELLRVPDDFKRAAFSVLCVAVEERLLAKCMIAAPEDHIDDVGYASVDEVKAAAEDLLSHVESCLDVAEALLTA